MALAPERTTITVVGAGSWGTALAILLARNGAPTRLWGHDPEHMARLARERINQEFLPDVPFPERLEAVSDLAEALQARDAVLFVVPSHAFREVLQQARPLLKAEQRLMSATKGLETGSGKLLHEVKEEVLGSTQAYAVLSGPTFAREVAAGLPTAITIASNDLDYAADLAHLFHNETFRAYTSTDLIGVELGGSVKNVLAIAAGIADGLGFGANTRAALITRGLAEIMRLGLSLGGQQETFMGLAGLGDLVLTCTDNQSRNRRFGLALAAGSTAEQAAQSIGQVVEGVKTAGVVVELARRQGVEMPITEQVYRVLYQRVDPREAVHELFRRTLKPEFSATAP